MVDQSIRKIRLLKKVQYIEVNKGYYIPTQAYLDNNSNRLTPLYPETLSIAPYSILYNKRSIGILDIGFYRSLWPILKYSKFESSLIKHYNNVT